MVAAASDRKQVRTKKNRKRPMQTQRGIKKKDDLEISSESEEDAKSSESELEEETAQEKRVRLAKSYLDDVKQDEQAKHSGSDSELDHKSVSARLREEVYEKAGTLHREVATTIAQPDLDSLRHLKRHRATVTAVTGSPDGKFIFSASSDACIIKYDMSTLQRLGTIMRLKKPDAEGDGAKKGHRCKILALAVSSDSKYLCSAGVDKGIQVWNTSDLSHVREFTSTGHRASITALCFRKGHNMLYSGSEDRSVKVWNLDEMGYIETLLGHQDGIVKMDALSKERAISCGGRDRTIRLWKIPEESQLVFNGHNGCTSIESVSLINEDHFVSGSDDGALSVWSIAKKKPVCVVRNAHKVADGVVDKNCWVTSVVCLKYTDLVVSGARDGFVKFWKLSQDYKNLSLMFSLPILGFVNDMCFCDDGKKLICAVANEHRMGRWWYEKGAKNSVVVIPILPRTVVAE